MINESMIEGERRRRGGLLDGDLDEDEGNEAE